MEVATAEQIVGQIVYKPDWQFEVADHTHRYEDAIKVQVTYPAYNSDRDQAALGYPEEVEGGARASFVIPVGDLADGTELCRGVFEKVMEIEEHEAREFLRLAPTMWAPFHPHRIDGTKRFGCTPEKDLQFGVC